MKVKQKYIHQLSKGDFVNTGRKVEEVIDTKIDTKDHRITYVETESGIYDSYTYGIVLP